MFDGIISAIGNLFSARVLKFIFIIFLIYAFAGILSFFPFFFGLFTAIFTFPLDFINFNIYPVGYLPYIFLYGALISLVVFLILKLFKH